MSTINADKGMTKAYVSKPCIYGKVRGDPNTAVIIDVLTNLCNPYKKPNNPKFKSVKSLLFSLKSDITNARKPAPQTKRPVNILIKSDCNVFIFIMF